MFLITNIVVQAKLNVKLSLKDIVYKIRDAKYQPKRFSAICWNHKKIAGSCLLFNNGKMVCHGSHTMAEARVIVRQYGRLVQKLGYPVKLTDVCLVTASALAAVGHSINLNEVSKYMPGATYEPELFNAAIIKKNGLHFAIFCSGKVVITGITNFALKNSTIHPLMLELALM